MPTQPISSTSGVENTVVNLAGLVQGIALVTFPAASAIFTDPSGYDLSNTQYGTMFLPQVVTAVAASLLGTRLARRFTAKRVLLLGLSADIASMLLLVSSSLISTRTAVAFPLLLLATACLGIGFGLTVPTLNTLVAAFRPDRADRGILVLNALLGLGTALAPVFVAVFVGLGFWWGLPLLSAAALLALIGVSLRLPLRAGEDAGDARSPGMPRVFWLFAAFAVLYGICETMNGNWSQVEMITHVGASPTQASLALTAFWSAVTIGRLLFAAVGRWLPARVVHHALPVALVATFALTAALPSGAPWLLGVGVFALAGLGCSALLPLTISLGQGALPSVSAAVAGGVIACYQVGYGAAAFGVGPLLDHGVSLSAVYGWTSVVAVAMAALSFVLPRRQPVLESAPAAGATGTAGPAELDPR